MRFSIFTKDNNQNKIMSGKLIRKSKSRHLDTHLNTDKGKQNKRKPFLYSDAYLGPEMVFVELGIEALLFARVDAHKMAPSCTLAAGTYIRQFMSGIQHQGSETPCSCSVRRLSITNPLSDIHEALRPVAYNQPRVDGQRLASPHEPNRLSTNTRIVPCSSCIKGKPAVKPCSFRPSPRYVLS